MSTVESVLWISLISIVLLFAAMFVIWGLMALMVKIPDKRETEAVKAIEAAEESPVKTAPEAADRSRDKIQAAALAVAIALALKPSAVRHAQPTSSEKSSAWQATQRSSQFSQRNQVFLRKRG